VTLTALFAILRKEFRVEFRSRSGFFAAGLFAVMAVFAISAASFNSKLPGNLSAGLVWVSLLFGSVIAVPRRFLQEEELRTADLLRLSAHPNAVYWGKTLFAIAETVAYGTVVSVLFFLLTSAKLVDPGLYCLGVLGTSICMGSVISLCGAIASQSANRTALASAISLPLIVPIVFMGIACLRVSMGEGLIPGGWRSGYGLVGYGIASLAIGPYLFAAVWKR